MRRRGTGKPGGMARSSARGRWSSLVMGLILPLGFLASAHAQISLTPGDPFMGTGRGGRHGNAQENNKTSPHIADLPPVKEPWPRLDTGAVLCKSRDDLLRYQARAVAGSDAGPAADCHAIRQRTPIQILDRDGLSRTHVVSTDDAKQTGWTNAYLPITPPPTASTGTAMKH
jgi:hypothetical protein